MSSLTAFCALLSSCQLLNQITQLPLVLLLKLSNSMLLTTQHLLSATQFEFRSCTTELVLVTGTASRHMHVLTCMSLLCHSFLSA